MRRLVLLVVLALVGVGAAVAPVDAQPEVRDNERPAMTTQRKIDDTTWKGPSGFWTNPYPAKGGAYRWRMMGIGGVVLAFTAFMVWRLIKKTRPPR